MIIIILCTHTYVDPPHACSGTFATRSMRRSHRCIASRCQLAYGHAHRVPETAENPPAPATCLKPCAHLTKNLLDRSALS